MTGLPFRINQRTWRAMWRDTLLLFREFQRPLLIFLVAIIGSGLLYDALAASAGEPVNDPVEAIYMVLAMTFLQSGNSFPKIWYLQVFYFVMPVIGVGILAQGLADFGVLLFNRRARGKEWEMAVASTFNNHIILIGLGHLGFRVIKQLYPLNNNIVVIDLNPDADLLKQIHDLDIPIIADDGARQSTLEAAGIQKAQTIILCTQNDSLNLQMAVKARSLNPDIHVIIRIFDDDFAQSLHQQFGFMAMSATGMAAPVFAAAAAGIDITPPITIEGQSHCLARLTVARSSKLIEKTIEEIENQYEISIVLLRSGELADFHPRGNIKVKAGDVIALVGNPERINILVHSNH